MPHFLNLACLLFLLLPFARADELRRDWIDPDTGHRIIRVSPDTGGSSLDFHQHVYAVEIAKAK